MIGGTAIVWGCLAVAAAVAVGIVIRTRWLQSHTLAKCVALSLGLHAVLAIICAFVGGWRPASWGARDEGPITMVVTLADEPSDTPPVADASETAAGESEPLADSDAGPAPAAEAPAVPLLAAADAEIAPPADHVPLLESPAEATPAESPDPQGNAASESPAAAPTGGASPAIPATYADRIGGRRAAAALARGGSEATEQAVDKALAWLASAQATDGHWSAAEHGGGVERAVHGHHRHGAGAKSDQGVSGLALLAFLGAGHTHRDGGHQATVDRGIRRLVAAQRADGSLAGDAEFFAALYCHGMATIALGECLALTGDAALRPALDRAVAHTLSMQHPHTGGWRYAAGDRGDTSQCGWQVMVLATARTAGHGGLEAAEARARVFLQSVSSGAAGGLAAYRPGERPSMAMTAEAIFCRLMLGLPVDHPAVAEALAMVSASPPQASNYNAYTWYYATLAAFHAGGPQWDRWNLALQAAVIPLQRRDGGVFDGSWDPDPVWGGHGGRVYATALAAMTLEVYYRHLPMHRRDERLARVAAP